MMVLVEGGLVARGVAAVREGLHQADAAQDVERAVDRSQTHGGQLGTHPLQDRLGGEVPSVAQGAEHGRALLGETIA